MINIDDIEFTKDVEDLIGDLCDYPNVEFVAETAKAVLVKIHGNREDWIPKSQCAYSEGDLYITQ